MMKNTPLDKLSILLIDYPFDPRTFRQKVEDGYAPEIEHVYIRIHAGMPPTLVATCLKIIKKQFHGIRIHTKVISPEVLELLLFFIDFAEAEWERLEKKKKRLYKKR